MIDGSPRGPVALRRTSFAKYWEQALGVQHQAVVEYGIRRHRGGRILPCNVSGWCRCYAVNKSSGTRGCGGVIRCHSKQGRCIRVCSQALVYFSCLACAVLRSHQQGQLRAGVAMSYTIRYTVGQLLRLEKAGDVGFVVRNNSMDRAAGRNAGNATV